MVAVINKDTCAQCCLCANVCPHQAITCPADDGYPAVDAAKCKNCGTCAEQCPVNAITVEGASTCAAPAEAAEASA